MEKISVNARTVLEVDCSALGHNIEQVRSLTDNNAELMAMVKADAYGVGLEGILPTFIEKGVTSFGISSLGEAQELARLLKAEHTTQNTNSYKIYLLGNPLEWEIEGLMDLGVVVSVSSMSMLEKVSETASKRKTSLEVMLVLDTGMGRMGVQTEDIPQVLTMLEKDPCLSLESMYTHFSVAGQPKHPLTVQQVTYSKEIRQLYPHVKFHTSASDAIVNLKDVHYDRVRPGLMLYGLEGRQGFRPTLRLYSHVLLVKRLPKGWNVGYENTYVLDKPSNIATVSIGYADGYSMTLSNQAWVVINSKKYPVVGRVSMDYTTVDLGDDEVSVGEEVTMMGGDGMKPAEMAQMYGVHIYELLSRFTKRVTKRYLK